jgi:hypothetical protein
VSYSGALVSVTVVMLLPVNIRSQCCIRSMVKKTLCCHLINNATRNSREREKSVLLRAQDRLRLGVKSVSIEATRVQYSYCLVYLVVCFDIEQVKRYLMLLVGVTSSSIVWVFSLFLYNIYKWVYIIYVLQGIAIEEHHHYHWAK